MDLDDFASDPVNFIDNLAQTSVQQPDFGIGASLEARIRSDPSFIESLPLVATPNDFMNTPPEKLVRFRCIFVELLVDYFIHLRIKNGEKYWNGITGIPSELHDIDDSHNLKELVCCIRVISSSIPSLTPWLRQILSGKLNNNNHLTTGVNIDSHLYSVEEYFENPFKCLVQFVTKIEPKLGKIYDVIGYFKAAGPINEDASIFEEEKWIHYLPCFQAFTYDEVKYLYPLSYFGVEQTFDYSIRDIIIENLSSIIDSISAELILLWLLGHKKSEMKETNQVFSLNLYNIDPVAFSKIANILVTVCTALLHFNISLQTLNSSDISIQRENGKMNESPFIVASGTRILLHETITDGQLQTKGIINYRFLSQLIEEQIIKYDFTGAKIIVSGSFPILVLSQNKSKFNCDIHYRASPKDSTNIPNFDRPEIRRYVEEVRYTQFCYENHSYNLIKEELPELIRDYRWSADNLNLFIKLVEINCLSYQERFFSKQRWNRTLKVFKEVMSQLN